MKARLSIQYEILIIFSLLIFLAIGSQFYIAASTFKRDKLALTYDLNENSVTAISSQLDATFLGAVDKLKVYTHLTASYGHEEISRKFSEILDNDPNIVHIEYRTPDSAKRWALKSSVSQAGHMETYTINSSYFERILPEKRPVPYSDIIDHDIAIWNASLPDGPPLIGLGLSILEKEGGLSRSSVVLCYLRADSLLKNITKAHITEVFVINADGSVLIHADRTLLSSVKNFSNLPVVQDFKTMSASSKVLQYNVGDSRMIGAYHRLAIGKVGVISQIAADKVFTAVNRLFIRTLIFALITFTLLLMLTFTYSRHLIKPIQVLMAAMRNVARGNLDTHFDLKASYEIGVLGESFNHMTADLKKSRLELEDANRNLEERVRVRTHQLEEMAVRDALTGLYNRRFFNEHIKMQFDRSKRTGKPVSIIYLDIDHFKKYNDQNGHPKGDSLLISLSQILSSTVRKTDIVARLGGEEFCIILPETDIDGAKNIAEKICSIIHSHSFPHGEKQPLKRVTCSIGISEYPHFAKDEEEIIKSADEALYRAKENGRNQVVLGKKLGHAA